MSVVGMAARLRRRAASAVRHGAPACTVLVCVGLLAWSAALLAIPDSAGAAVTCDPGVRSVMDQVTQLELQPAVQDLSGVTSPLIGGSPFTITTRAYKSGTSIDKAEQYVYERLSGYGLDAVSYVAYSGGGGGRNVVGQIDGSSPTHADEIVIIAAHLDDYPWSGKAPGADDNASGVSTMLFLARSFAGRGFERTIRFVATGDEEHRGAGADEYAAACVSRGENVVGVIVPDMLAYDNGTHTIELYVRPTAHDPGGGDMAMAQLYVDVVAAYGIGVTPVVFQSDESYTDADHFWAHGIHAVDISEGWTPTNPYYHTALDDITTFHWPYYVNVSKGVVGLTGHLAGIDSAAPVVTGSTSATHPSESQWYAVAAPSFSWSAADTQTGISGYSRVLDREPATVPDTTSEGTGTSWTSPQSLADGVWYFHVRARDGAGNWGAATHRAVHVDTGAPSVDDDADGTWASVATVHVTATDGDGSGVQSVQMRADGGAWQPAAELTLGCWRRGGGSGVHAVEYRAVDVAGNVSDVGSCQVRLDGRAPRTTSDAPGAAVAGPRTVTLTPVDQAGLSGVATTWYKLDDGSWTEGEAVPVSGVGRHWLQYYSVDVAGNVETCLHATEIMLL